MTTRVPRTRFIGTLNVLCFAVFGIRESQCFYVASSHNWRNIVIGFCLYSNGKKVCVYVCVRDCRIKMCQEIEPGSWVCGSEFRKIIECAQSSITNSVQGKWVGPKPDCKFGVFESHLLEMPDIFIVFSVKKAPRPKKYISIESAVKV